MRIGHMISTIAIAATVIATPPPAAVAQAGGAKIAVIDVTSIITGSKNGKVMVAEL